MLSNYVSVALIALVIHHFLLQPLLLNSLSKIPGPKLFALTKWRLAFEDWRGERTRVIHKLHQRYGPVIRIGLNEIHFNSLTALHEIYGAGSRYERTSFYRMFDVYGKQNLFTFHTSEEHAARKKMLAFAYSKSLMMKHPSTTTFENRVEEYLDLLEINGDAPNDTFKTLHYFSIDSITHVLYGPKYGATSALTGNSTHRALLDDILDPARRSLSWFAVHHPKFTKWLYTRTHLLGQVLQPFLPMKKPSTYSGIRAHALQAFDDSCNALQATDGTLETSIIGLLLSKQKDSSLEDMDIASECADHLLAGIDTTADTLMFLFWRLSLPENKDVQERLIAEIRNMCNDSRESPVTVVEASDKLEYLDAVIKETLRLYAPLPASEPRSLPNRDSIIDDYNIPAGTVVSMSPYSLHRNSEVFQDPLEFKPERWFRDDVATLNRWFWAWSSGGRMCIGKHLAMAEMTTLVTAVYEKYTTAIAPGFERKSPAITSRFELFYDETMPDYEVSTVIYLYSNSYR